MREERGMIFVGADISSPKKNAGITLIALVITIIVLLILAGLSISMVLGENGVLKNSEEAVQNTKIAEIDEQAEFIAGTAAMEQYQGKSFEESVKIGLKSYQNFNQIPEMSADGKTATITEIETGREYEINSNYNVTYIGTQEDNTVVADGSWNGTVNTPKVSLEMIPIKWNGSNWVVCSTDDPNWYSYDGTNNHWANIMLSDGTYTVSSVTVGQVVQESELRKYVCMDTKIRI